jgi:hypothetical protein
VRGGTTIDREYLGRSKVAYVAVEVNGAASIFPPIFPILPLLILHPLWLYPLLDNCEQIRVVFSNVVGVIDRNYARPEPFAPSFGARSDP